MKSNKRPSQKVATTEPGSLMEPLKIHLSQLRRTIFIARTSGRLRTSTQSQGMIGSDSIWTTYPLPLPGTTWYGECLFLFNFACGSSAWSYAWPIYWATCPSSKSMLKLEVGIKQNIMQTRQELITPTFEFPNFGFFFHPLRGILASQPA